jgi:hypothetical protein
MRRGAAWPPAARPSSCVAVQPAVSRWQVPHRRAVMVAERRVCRPQQHGSPSHRALVTLSASTCPERPAVQCPASGTCPVSGVRYMSSVRAPGVRASDIQCRVRFQCPVRASGIRVHLSAPVSSWSAWVRQAATRLETGRPGNYLTRGSLSPDWSHGLKHLRFVMKAQALCQTVFATS